MSSNRVNSGQVLRAVQQLEEATRAKLNDLHDEVASIQCAVDSAFLNTVEDSMSNGQTQSQPDLSQLMPQIQQFMAQQQAAPSPAVDFEARINKALDSKVDAMVDRVIEVQKANKSFWTSPVFIGCVAGGALLLIGGTLYYYNQRINALEDISTK